MTIHNQLAHSAELQNGIAAAAGLPRDADGVIRLGETLTPNLDAWSQPEWAFLRGERLGAIAGFAAAVAAEFSICCLGNAAGSGNIVVVESITGIAGTAGTNAALEVVADTVVAATLSAAAFAVSGRDRRFGSTTGRTFFKSGTDPASTFGVRLETIASDVDRRLHFEAGLPLILKPGDDCIVIAQTVNIGWTVNFRWRERKAFTGELTTA